MDQSNGNGWENLFTTQVNKNMKEHAIETIKFMFAAMKNFAATNKDMKPHNIDSKDQSREFWDEILAFLITKENFVQSPHIDFEVDHKNKKFGYIMDLPLCSSGCDIFIWDNDGTIKELYHIPFGTFLIRRSDVYHSGHSGGKGNLRLHLCICHNAADRLLRYPNALSLEAYDNRASKDPKVDFTIDQEKAITVLDHSEAIERLAKENIKNVKTEHYFFYNGNLEDTFKKVDVVEKYSRKRSATNTGNFSSKKQKQNRRGGSNRKKNAICTSSDDSS